MEVKVNIPESLDEITVEQYQRFVQIENPTNEDILNVFLGLDLEGINNIKASDVDKICPSILGLFEGDVKFKDRFVLNGVEFGFVPNLDDISYGEYKDVSKYISDWKTMNKALAVLFRPIKNKLGKKYNVEKYEGSHKYSEMMKHTPLNVAMGMMVFFYNLTSDLLKAIPNYMEKEMLEDSALKQTLEENGETINNYIHLLKETLEDLTKLLNNRYINV